MATVVTRLVIINRVPQGVLLVTTLSGWPIAESDLALALKTAMAFAHGTMGLLLLCDEDSGTMRVAAVHGLTPEERAKFEEEIAWAGIVALACEEQRRVCLPNARQNELASLAALSRAIAFRGIDIHPLAMRDARVIGALVMLYRWPQRPSRHEAATARPCCELIACALDAARRSSLADDKREAAEGLARERLQFVARMSHEMRTPLQSIMGYLELLRNGLPDPVTERQAEMLGRVATSEAVLMNVLNDLDNLARIEAGHVQFAREPVPARTLALRALAVVEPIARQLGVGIEASGLPAATAVADSAKATQILVNLLTNAAKFSPRGTAVQLTIRRCGASLCFDVSDAGPGIPAERLVSIFDPYVQLGNRVPMGLQGFGLGLAISREFAQGMGGDIAVSSTEGLGTTFTLRLPASRTSNAARSRRPRRLERFPLTASR